MKRKNKIACPPARLYTICHGIFLFSHCVLVRATNTWMGFIWAADLQVFSKTRPPTISFIHYTLLLLLTTSHDTAQEAPNIRGKVVWLDTIRRSLFYRTGLHSKGVIARRHKRRRRRNGVVFARKQLSPFEIGLLATDRNLLVTVHVFYKPQKFTSISTRIYCNVAKE